MIHSAQIRINTKNVSRRSPPHLIHLDSFQLLLFKGRYYFRRFGWMDWTVTMSSKWLNYRMAERHDKFISNSNTKMFAVAWRNAKSNLARVQWCIRKSLWKCCILLHIRDHSVFQNWYQLNWYYHSQESQH